MTPSTLEDVAPEAVSSALRRVAELTERYADCNGVALLRPLIECEFAGQVAIVSSFGAEAAVILAQVAEIDRDTPILFLDTGKLFSETLHYRDRLVAQLGLRDVRTIIPAAEGLGAVDPQGMLWLDDPDACCAARKVAPLASALSGFAAWVSGRKRYQGGARAALPVFEADGAGRIKVNPLAKWPKSRVDLEFASHGLPHHPLEAQGYVSIGCVTCTDRAHLGDEPRAGRWRGLPKTECGIHEIIRRRGAA